MDNIWLISIAALVAGAVIGFLMGRSGGGAQRQAELAVQLEQKQKELDDYKEEVSQHFEKTASLVNNLTSSYKDVHEHLATGAQGLCQAGNIDLALEPSLTPKLESEEQAATETDAKNEEPSAESQSEQKESTEPPRDYAPKAPEDEGTLSETFGLKEETEQKDEEVAPTPVDAAETGDKAKA